MRAVSQKERTSSSALLLGVMEASERLGSHVDVLVPTAVGGIERKVPRNSIAGHFLYGTHSFLIGSFF